MPHMYATLVLLALGSTGVLGQGANQTAVLPATQGGPLNITALAARGNASVIECWQLPGQPVLLGSTVHWQLAARAAQPELTVLAPRTTVGQAWSSSVQLEILIAGKIRITAPYVDASDTGGGGGGGGVETRVAVVEPGAAGSAMIITADVREASATGHRAEFPGDDNSVVVQIPFAGNAVPEHTVLHNGSCTAQEATGSGGEDDDSADSGGDGSTDSGAGEDDSTDSGEDDSTDSGEDDSTDSGDDSELE